MSKNVVIQEGGEPKRLNGVNKLQAFLSDGSTQLWIPEDEAESFARLDNKNITENGTYYASDDGLDGYDTINVNVKVSGIDPDDGEDHVIDVDPETEELIDTKVPARIEITREPDKLEYKNGETINPTGIIVHAYFRDGSDYGTVLNSELQYEPEQASGGGRAAPRFTTPADETSQVHSAYGVTFSFALAPVGTVFYGNLYNSRLDMWRTATLIAAEGRVYAFRENNDGIYENVCIVSSKPFTLQYISIDSGTSSGYYTTEKTFNLDVPGGRAASFYQTRSDSGYNDWIPYVDTSGKFIYYFYNDILKFGDGAPIDDAQTITVKWPRIGDGKILTDTFDITVTAAEDSGSNDQGGS